MATPKTSDPVFKNRIFRMEGSYSAQDLVLKAAVVKEGLSKLTETTIEFLSNDRALKLDGVVGQEIRVILEDAEKKERTFAGTCISAEFLGLYQGFGHFTAEIRPWLWMLTRSSDNRIFQNLSVPDIISKILSDHGFSSELQNKLTETYDKREYCVQYGETDFDFISRLMEEEGIYYYFTTPTGDTHLKMVLSDSLGAHPAVEGDDKIPFKFREAQYRRADDHIFEWSATERVTSAQVALIDYNFETPKTPLTSVKMKKKGKHPHAGKEFYDYPGHFRETSIGDKRARVKIEAEAVRHQRWMGVGNHRRLAAGSTFKLMDHPRVKDETEFLITDATHYLQIETDYEDTETLTSVLGNRLDFGPGNTDSYRCVFGVIPKAEQFRAPLSTPWPRISGLQTAVVVGPKGEEIYTDKYGRIKVQFHWDREGKKDENTTCWVRTVMPWTGKNWGMVAIPRIGQEVVINFEEGDPDRPICTGMLYNAATMPPYGLPDNMTQSGIKTNSSKGGGGFNELMFEDKKDEELVRFQAEKDYEQIVKNDASITIGKEKNDPGNLTLFVQNDQTETTVKHKKQTVGESYNLQIGNKTSHSDLMSSASKLFSQLRFSASPSVSGVLKMGYDSLMSAAASNSFNETIEGAHSHVVTVDHSQMIGGKHDHNVIGKFAQTVGLDHDHLVGVDYNLEIKRHHKQTVDDNYIQTIKGKNEKTVTKDKTTTVEQGDIKINAKLGQIDIEAMKKIVLKVGTNKIELSQTGIKINGVMIEASADTTAEVKAGAVLTLKGGMTMIN